MSGRVALSWVGAMTDEIGRHVEGFKIGGYDLVITYDADGSVEAVLPEVPRAKVFAPPDPAFGRADALRWAAGLFADGERP